MYGCVNISLTTNVLENIDLKDEFFQSELLNTSHLNWFILLHSQKFSLHQCICL